MTLEPRNSLWSSEIAWAFDLGMPAVPDEAELDLIV
jgi:hypothetical protein